MRIRAELNDKTVEVYRVYGALAFDSIHNGDEGVDPGEVYVVDTYDHGIQLVEHYWIENEDEED